MKKLWKKWISSIWGKVSIVALVLILVGILSYLLYFKNQFQFQENEDIFLAGVQNYYEHNPLRLPDDGTFTEVSLEDMYKGSWVESLFIPGSSRLCSEDSFVRVIADGEEYHYMVALTCGKYHSRVDSTAPVITLKGDETIVLHLGSEFQDPGIEEVKDNKDKLSIEDVKVDTSKLDLTKTGTYQVTYKVHDKSYNVAKVNRTVIVADTLSGKIEREKGSGYVYRGLAEDNYVLFSGMLFRIVKLNADKSVVLITENNIANVSYNTNEESYPDSNIYTWLNQVFLPSISSNSSSYLVDQTWCYDEQNAITAANSCQQSVTGKVGLLTLNDFLNSKDGNVSYLLDNGRFSFLNKMDARTIWMSDLNNSDSVNTMTSNSLTGVRPVIALSSDICITAGDGTYDNPYKLQDYSYGKENELLNTRLIGEYVVYSGYLFRIRGIDEDGNIQVVSAELLKNQTTGDLLLGQYADSITSFVPNVGEEGNLYYMLNNDIINHLSESSIVRREYTIPRFDATRPYFEWETKAINSYLSIPASYEMFSAFSKSHLEQQQIYWLSDYDEEGNVTILNGNNGIAFHLREDSFPENAFKVVLTLDKKLEIASGRGTMRNPYYVR